MSDQNINIKEQQLSKIKELLSLGKEQGYLTYSDVNDYLPDEITDPERIEEVVQMINDVGVKVFESAPDAEDLLMIEGQADGTADEDAVQALSSDGDFGRTTDPVRMYMREMGSVDLLTRSGEIEIAKRIEEGTKEVLDALSGYPFVIKSLLGRYQMLLDNAREEHNALEDELKDETPLHQFIKFSDLITGFNEGDEVDASGTDVGSMLDNPEETLNDEAGSDDDSGSNNVSDTVEDTGPDPEVALAKFKELEESFNKLLDLEGGTKAYVETVKSISSQFLALRFTSAQLNRLINAIRGLVSEIRAHDRKLMRLCVEKGKMPKNTLLTTFKVMKQTLCG